MNDIDALDHPDIIALLANPSHGNWFDMLHPISDRLRELGDDGKADRCIDLIMERKRPYRSDEGFYCWCRYEGPEDKLGEETVTFIDRLNDMVSTRTIQPQLTAYLLVPEELRIRRSR